MRRGVFFLLVFNLIFIIFSFQACQQEQSKPNILLITIDTLRRDHLGIYGYPRQTSPFIDSLARQGLVCKQAVTPIPITSGSHATILTSLHPITHGLLTNGFNLNPKIQTLAEVLKKNDYYTIGTTSVSLLDEARGFNQGFDSFTNCVSSKRKQGPATDPANKVNERLFGQIGEYLSNHRDKPLFIWIHYFDPHTPYTNHQKYKFKEKIPVNIRKINKDNTYSINHYDKEIRYVDEAIKNLLDHLKENDLTEKLVTCITSDHGEQHGEHGYWNGHYDFYTETLCIPLIFQGYGIPKNKIINARVTTMDIAETLVHMAGATFDYNIDGANLVSLFRDQSWKNTFSSGDECLIVSHPPDSKSLQLIKYPYSYILNLDRYYKYWYFSDKETLPVASFQRVHETNIELTSKKSKKITIRLPDEFRKRIEYAAFKIYIKESDYNKQVNVRFNYRLFTSLKINQRMDQLTVIHPVTSLDTVSFKLNLSVPPSSKLSGMDYTILSPGELLNYSKFLNKKKNQVFKQLRPVRKNIDHDELYNLKDDFEMKHNLLAGARKVVDSSELISFTDSIYKLYETYYRKGRKLFGRPGDIKRLSKKEKENLKSLGYL
jgi:predicted AlkP superfamily pyrophosphatase or phosphodiesterase